MTTAGCLPIGPGRERKGRARDGGKRERKEVKKEASHVPSLTLFAFSSLCFQSRPDGCHWVGLKAYRGEDVSECVVVCVLTGFVRQTAETSLCMTHTDLQQAGDRRFFVFSISISLMNITEMPKDHWPNKLAVFPAGSSITLTSIYACKIC